MKVFWTQTALEDRRAIYDYIETDSPTAALALDESIALKASNLTDYPNLGRPGRVAGTRELIAHQNYLLIYDTAADMVRVLRVLHTARRWPPTID